MKSLPLFIFTLIATASWAQVKDLEFIVGPNLGTIRSNLSNPGSETKSSYNAKIGFSAGVGSTYYFNDKFSLGAQLLYQRTSVRGDFPFEGTNQSGTNYSGSIELTTSFDHISIPIRARYTIGNKIKFSGEAGGFVNIQLNSTAKDYSLYGPENPNYLMINEAILAFAKASEQYTRFDAGLSLGFSSQIPLNEKLRLKVSLYDNYGLVNISALNFPQYPISNTNYLKSNTVNLLAAIVYSL